MLFQSIYFSFAIAYFMAHSAKLAMLCKTKCLLENLLKNFSIAKNDSQLILISRIFLLNITKEGFP